MSAIAIQADISYAQRLATADIRKTLTTFKKVAIERAIKGATSIITRKEIDRLVRTMTGAKVLANKLGRDRVRKYAKIIQASVLDNLTDDPSYSSFYGDSLRIVTGYTQKVNDSLELFTRELVTQNLPTSSMVKLLNDEFRRLGVDPKNAYTLENLARTQTQLTYNAAKYREEQEDYIQDILWGYTYSTVRDNRVRDEHADVEGVTLPKEDPFWLTWYPPNGWSCRCAVIPVFESVRIKRPPSGIAIDPDFSGLPTALLGL
jgi:SPP1 gp7 family putative phage head morphogenesis protein